MAARIFIRSIFLLFTITFLSGCGGTSSTVPTVQASGPLPFPAITSAGTTVTLEPGVYTCPTGILAGTRIVGHGAVIPPEMITDNAFAPLPPPAPVVRIVCSGNLTLTDLTGLDISGVVFDFQNSGGLFLDTVAWSHFDLGITHSTTALTVQGRDGNNGGNVFPRIVIYEAQTGILLQGVDNPSTGQPSAVTWNDFGHVDIVHAHQYGINFSQYVDSNTFRAVRINLIATATAGVVFNDKGILGDMDASGNIVSSLSCDGGTTFPGYCVDFRGYTVGNQVTVAFGTMPDGNKIHFANAFSQTANNVVKMQENPKVP
jgi:hypothetical protein